MADSTLEQDSSRHYRTWVLGLVGSIVLVIVLGLSLAALTGGAALPWTGAAFVISMGLALVVGASKTSSA